jgi:hypothetical protein
MNVNDNENASAMLDELDATETENNDPFVMFDSMGLTLVSSHVPTPTLAPLVRGSPTPQALQRLAYAKTEFHNSRVRFHAILRAPMPGSRHCMPLLGPQTNLTYNCWIAFRKYVKLHAGWKLSRRVAHDQCIAANNKRKLYCIDAVYTHGRAQPLAAVAVVAPLAGSGSDNHIWNVVSSTGNLQHERPAVGTASNAVSTATATMDDVLVDSTNVATSINATEQKPPAQTIPTVTPSAPPVAATAVVAITSTSGMNANQSPTSTTTTSHVFRYGDLVTFPLVDITPPTTLKAIVVQVHPVNGDCAGKGKDEDATQLVTVSTGPGKRFTVPIHRLVLIRPITSAP